MKYLTLFIFFPLFLYSQEVKPPKRLVKTAEERAKELAKKADIKLYKIYSIKQDTVLVDTTLTIKKEYEYNYQRKDNFGKLLFPNEGQTYNLLDFGLSQNEKFPQFGYSGKHSNYLGINEVRYYNSPTPYSQVFYKSVMEQGQAVETLISVNTSKNFNFSISYKGIRSLGKYINQLSSNGNFKLTASYVSTKKRYSANFHFTGQDLLNGENGGLTTISDFENGDQAFDNRPRLELFLKDAKSFLKGKRYFLDHNYKLFPDKKDNNLVINHQFFTEFRMFEYNQVTLGSQINQGAIFNRFGVCNQIGGNINDQTTLQTIYNKIGAQYTNVNLGKFNFFADNYNYKYYINPILPRFSVANPTVQIAPQISSSINTIGGQYDYSKKNIYATLLLSNSITQNSTREIVATMSYKLNDKNNFFFQYSNNSKAPNFTYQLHQSEYVAYNWQTNFVNEKSNEIYVLANTQYATAQLKIQNLTDLCYFSDVSPNLNQQILSPFQYSNSINYLSLKINKEIKYNKFALDNTFLYQVVSQQDNIVNVPKIVLRNSLYYSNYFYKRALFTQIGVTVNYFSKYYANDYNPIVGDFFVQTNKQIGNYPTLDFFVNGRIRQTRIFFKAEHFNQLFAKNNYLVTPNLPYRDFIVRFGVVWDFFQ